DRAPWCRRRQWLCLIAELDGRFADDLQRTLDRTHRDEVASNLLTATPADCEHNGVELRQDLREAESRILARHQKASITSVSADGATCALSFRRSATSTGRP